MFRSANFNGISLQRTRYQVTNGTVCPYHIYVSSNIKEVANSLYLYRSKQTIQSTKQEPGSYCHPIVDTQTKQCVEHNPETLQRMSSET